MGYSQVTPDVSWLLRARHGYTMFVMVTPGSPWLLQVTLDSPWFLALGYSRFAMVTPGSAWLLQVTLWLLQVRLPQVSAQCGV